MGPCRRQRKVSAGDSAAETEQDTGADMASEESQARAPNRDQENVFCTAHVLASQLGRAIAGGKPDIDAPRGDQPPQALEAEAAGCE